MPFRRNFLSRGGSRVIIETLDTPRSRLGSSTTLVDLRRKPRYDTHFAGEAVSGNGSRAYVTVTNVSLSGLRFDGAERDIALLTPGSLPDGPHLPVLLTVSFSLSGPSDLSGIVRVRCETVYVRNGGDHKRQVGAQFLSVEEGEEVFTDYIGFRGSHR